MIDHSQTYTRISLRNIVHRRRLQDIFDIVAAMRLPSGLAYGDIGCSGGYISAQIGALIKAASIHGFDRNPAQFEQGRLDHPEVSFSYLDLLEGPPPVLDFLTCFETLEHLGDLELGLANLLSTIRMGLISVPIEIGAIGVAKYAFKRTVFRGRYSYDELTGATGGAYRKALLGGERISRFRSAKDAYGTHFGFDYRDVDDFLRGKVSFKAFNRGASRFYVIA